MKKDITYRKWLADWVQIYKKPYIKTWRDIKRDIEIHVPVWLLSSPLVELTAFDVQKALTEVKTSRMRVEMFDIYHGSLHTAYKVGFLDRDIASALIKPKHVRKVGSALTRSEVADFLESIKFHCLKNYYTFCLLTGCRRCEALSVTWKDIDLSKNRLHIPGTKTETSDRYIPLYPELRELLGRIEYKGDKLFYHSRYYVTSKFKDFCPEHKLHDLRHTFATRCIESGVSMKVVQTWLGHARLDTTASIYTHLLPDFIQSESEKIKIL